MPGRLTRNTSTSCAPGDAMPSTASPNGKPALLDLRRAGSRQDTPRARARRRPAREGRSASALRVCPTTPLTRQWATAAAASACSSSRMPRAADPRATSTASRSPTPGRAATRGAGAKVRRDTLVVVERRTISAKTSPGVSASAARSRGRALALASGTPFGSRCHADPRHSLRRHGVVCPTSPTPMSRPSRRDLPTGAFVTFDGSLSWRSGDNVIESSFETVLTGARASRRYRTAISTSFPRGCHGSSKGQRQAARAARRRTRRRGRARVAAEAAPRARSPELLSERPGARRRRAAHRGARRARAAAFAGSRDPWIVAVNMVSEGVDIPRLRVGVYASAAKTP